LKVTILCVGKLGTTPEAVLALEWARRAGQVGRPHGLFPIEIVEVEARRAGKAAEGEALLTRVQGAHLVACDEHGSALASRAFADWLGVLRDDGARSVVFAIGGADGLDERVTAAAQRTLAFGPQTWPHALVRAMLAEQIYRAATLMAGQPYHRD
jgi:23S rRNA (pseudouridine1915-N3)-methyltransferase